MTLLWRLLADWCLTYEGGKSVLSGMWLTEGDPCWPVPCYQTITVTISADPSGFEASMRRAANAVRALPWDDQ